LKDFQVESARDLENETHNQMNNLSPLNRNGLNSNAADLRKSRLNSAAKQKKYLSSNEASSLVG
jgi:hypothetical protein